MSDDETEVKSSKRTKLIGGGILGVICLFLVIFLPIWFLVIDVDNDEAVEVAKCKGFYTCVDCMPEQREQDGKYIQETCESRGCIWDESSDPKEHFQTHLLETFVSFSVVFFKTAKVLFQHQLWLHC